MTGIKHREFRLIVEADPVNDEDFGVRIEETNGRAENTHVVARSNPRATSRIRSRVLDAVRRSGHPKTALHSARTRPIPLEEEPGVRLSLVILGTSRMSKARRIEEIADGVASMTTEEAYYWYAKSVGHDGRRAQRALRLFLSQD